VTSGNPTVSVLMACYNAEAFIGAALKSIQAQTYDNIEIVVVDDGSTDNSSRVVQDCADAPVTIIQQENRGAAFARNAALRHSHGSFVLFVDSDDLIAPDHVEAMIDRIRDEPGCVALSRWDRFRADPAEARFPDRPTEKDMPGPDWLELDWRNARPMTQSGMIMLPRSLLDQHGGWDERLSLSDDFEFFARMISKCAGVRFAPEARLFYRSAVAGSLSGRKSREAIESAYLSLNLGVSHLLAAKDTPAARRVCANMLQDFDYTYFPHFADLRTKARSRIAELGGADLVADGPPGFRRLRPLVGWKFARLAQRAANRLRRTGLFA
jgi:glycosyltransferase involved in cell wall biosynthesis